MHASPALGAWLAASLFCSSVAHARPAAERSPAAEAPPASASDDAVDALELGHDGLRLFEAGEFLAALQMFERAERAAYSPVFVLYRARCHLELGDWQAASELLERVASEPVLADAPEVWRAARDAARLEARALAERMPSLEIVVRGAVTQPLVLTDGHRKYSFSGDRLSLKVAPGEHALELADAAGLRAERRVHVAEGDRRRRLEFDLAEAQTLESPPEPASERSQAPDTPKSIAPTPSADSPTPWGALTAVGLGTGALVFGGVAGIVALSKRNAIIDNCIGNQCLASDRDAGIEARRWANAATAGFIVGAVTLGVGVTLLIYRPEAPSRHAVSLSVAPTGVSLSGDF